MQDHGSTDPAVLLMGALADEIADRLASRLAPHLAEIVEAGGFDVKRAHPRHEDASANATYDVSAPAHGLWTARRVAVHYGVAVRFIYQHAEALGAVRLGGGARPRLRFDPKVVRERWPRVGDTRPESSATRHRSNPRPSYRRRSDPAGYELLPFDREP